VDELMHLGEVVEARPEKKKEGAYLLVQLGGETQRAEVCGSRYELSRHRAGTHFTTPFTTPFTCCASTVQILTPEQRRGRQVLALLALLAQKYTY